LAFEFTYNVSTLGFVVCHTCDNPPCCNPRHLFKGTNAVNTADRVKKGRSSASRGERNWRAILTEEQVREIRGSALSHTELARRYGVGRTAIAAVRERKTWRHVQPS
jgi:hypothetical protein